MYTPEERLAATRRLIEHHLEIYLNNPAETKANLDIAMQQARDVYPERYAEAVEAKV